MKQFGYLYRIPLLAALFAAFAATTAFAQEARVSIPSSKSFDQTVEAFKMAVSKGGMMVMSTVDQGISQSAVKTRLHRARLMLREALTPVFAKPEVSMWERWKGMNPWLAAKR